MRAQEALIPISLALSALGFVASLMKLQQALQQQGSVSA